MQAQPTSRRRLYVPGGNAGAWPSGSQGACLAGHADDRGGQVKSPGAVGRQLGQLVPRGIGHGDDAAVVAENQHAGRRGIGDDGPRRAGGTGAAPGVPGLCHHEVAFGLAVETMRDSAFGGWDTAAQRRRILRIGDPVPESLASVAGDAVFIPRLDAAIRALGTAASRDTCVRGRARCQPG